MFSKFAVHRKSLNRLEHVHSIIFKGRTAADDVGKPSSRLPQDLVTRKSLSWGYRHFLSFVFGVDACFVFDFVVFYLWVNSDNITRRQSRHTAWFQIPYLGSCPPLIDWKISLIQFGKMFGQSHMGTNLLPDLYGLVRIRFQINHFFK